jgi:hypothetical protein
MLNPRFLITILVASQIFSYSIGDLSSRIQSGIVTPLFKLIGGSDDFNLIIGPFNLGIVIGGIFSCIVTILLGLLMLALILKLTWKWIERLIPESVSSTKTQDNP